MGAPWWEPRVLTIVFKDEGNNPDNVFYFNYDGIKGCYNKQAMFDSVLPENAGRQTFK